MGVEILMHPLASLQRLLWAMLLGINVLMRSILSWFLPFAASSLACHCVSFCLFYLPIRVKLNGRVGRGLS